MAAPTQSPAYIRAHYAGVVESRKRRATGTVVTVYNAAQAGMDAEAGPWATVCEEHGQIMHHPTLALAQRHAPVGGGCEVCEWRLHGLVHEDDPNYAEEE